MISSRFALPVVALVGLALVPTVVHSYIGLKADDGLETTAVGHWLAGMPSEPTARRPGWGKARFDSDDWIERSYRKPGGGDVVLFVGRSFDPKRLYHHPEQAVAYGTDLRSAGTRRLEEMPDVPVFLLESAFEGRTDLVAYSLLCEQRFIENPYIFQMRSTWELLFSRRKAMTLFFAHDPAHDAQVPLERAPATRLLFDAIRSFLAQARPGSR